MPSIIKVGDKCLSVGAKLNFQGCVGVYETQANQVKWARGKMYQLFYLHNNQIRALGGRKPKCLAATAKGISLSPCSERDTTEFSFLYDQTTPWATSEPTLIKNSKTGLCLSMAPNDEAAMQECSKGNHQQFHIATGGDPSVLDRPEPGWFKADAAFAGDCCHGKITECCDQRLSFKK